MGSKVSSRDCGVPRVYDRIILPLRCLRRKVRATKRADQSGTFSECKMPRSGKEKSMLGRPQKEVELEKDLERWIMIYFIYC